MKLKIRISEKQDLFAEGVKSEGQNKEEVRIEFSGNSEQFEKLLSLKSKIKEITNGLSCNPSS